VGGQSHPALSRVEKKKVFGVPREGRGVGSHRERKPLRRRKKKEGREARMKNFTRRKTETEKKLR